MSDPAPNPHELTVVSSSEDGVGVVRADGELDANSAGRLRAAFDELFAAGSQSFVVDLAGVSFIDSSGLSALIYGYKQASERDGQMTVRSPSPSVIRLLEITGQSDRFLHPER